MIKHLRGGETTFCLLQYRYTHSWYTWIDFIFSLQSSSPATWPSCFLRVDQNSLPQAWRWNPGSSRGSGHFYTVSSFCTMYSRRLWCLEGFSSNSSKCHFQPLQVNWKTEWEQEGSSGWFFVCLFAQLLSQLHGYKCKLKLFHSNTAYLRILKLLSAFLHYSKVVSNVFCVCTKEIFCWCWEYFEMSGESLQE